MIVRFTRQARVDLTEIRVFVAGERPQIAETVVRRNRQVVAHLAEHPEIGRPGRVTGTPELIVSRLPFIVAYRTDGRHVDVVAILHAARRWPDRFADR